VKKSCAKPDKVIILPLDLSNPEKVLSQAQQFLTQSKQKIDILINNGGISMRSGFLENSFENEITMLNVNYLSQIALTKVTFTEEDLSLLTSHLGGIAKYVGKKERTYCFYE